MTFLFISGHGENKNGSFDPGATGIIKKGEHRYFEENFFPAVKKYLPKNSDVVLFSEYNVYDYKNLVTLADKYGKNTIVIEMHYDAGSSAASGGHVIVHSAFAPDKYDLAIRDVIQKHIGVRYEHKGHKGISGRDNLGNCNRAKSAGLNYRLVELGFGTNAKDAKVMVDNVDDIAKDFVRALLGEVLDSVPTEPVKAPTPKPATKPIVSTPVEVKPVAKPVTPKVSVDGWLGKNTIKELQKYFGTPVDGILSKPSMVIRSLQKLLGVTADGLMGPNTIRAMQKRFGTPQDGKLSEPSMVIKELQRRLNAGKL